MSALKRHKGLAIAHMNIRSLWPKLDMLKLLLQNEVDIDILGLSESWLTGSLNDNLVNIPNYDIVRNDRNWGEKTTDINGKFKKGGGVCIYVKHNINYSTHSLCMFNVSCQNVECHWVKIIQENQRNIVIANIYRPPQGNVKKFVDYLEGVIENLDLDREDLILLGDLNIDFMDKKSSDFKQIDSLLSQIGLVAHIKEPTHFSKNRNSCLDQIVSNSNFIETCGVENFNISDHLMVYVIRKKSQ